MKLTGTNNIVYLLGNKLGSGGEGVVYSISSDSSLVAKVFNSPVSDLLAQKLRYMLSVNASTLTQFTTWPQDILVDDYGSIVGYTMKQLIGYMPIHSIFSPVDRKRILPGKGYNFLVHVARNLAIAFYQIHKQGIIVGDINEGNVFVDSNGIVCLIDTDSFQISTPDKVFHCEVGVPRYTAPELLQQNAYKSVARTLSTDSFGLAVLIFQLLFLGRHPFAGRNNTRTEINEELAIKKGYFAFSKAESKSKRLLPPKNSLSIDVLPDSLYKLFIQSFESETRPQDDVWIKELGNFLDSLMVCSVSATHHYPVHYSSCPWCSFKKNSSIDYFLDAAAFYLDKLSLDIIDIEELKAIKELQYEIEDKKVDTSSLVLDQLVLSYYSGFIVVVLLPILMYFLWSSLLLYFILGIIVIFLCWVMHSVNKQKNALQNLKESTIKEENDFHQLKKDLLLKVNISGYHDNVSKLKDLLSVYDAMDTNRVDIVNQVEQRCFDIGLKKYLSYYFIEDANIPSIGNTKKAALKDAGIITANDIDKLQSIKVKGVGAENRLILDTWVQEIVRSYKYEKDETVYQEQFHFVEREYGTKKELVKDEIRICYANLLLHRSIIDNNYAKFETIAKDKMNSIEVLRMNFYKQSRCYNSLLGLNKITL